MPMRLFNRLICLGEHLWYTAFTNTEGREVTLVGELRDHIASSLTFDLTPAFEFCSYCGTERQVNPAHLARFTGAAQLIAEREESLD